MSEQSQKPESERFSGIFAPLYACPKCGEVWKVDTVQLIDADNDELYEEKCCSRCASWVKPLIKEGNQIVHPLTNEEMQWDIFDEEYD